MNRLFSKTNKERKGFIEYYHLRGALLVFIAGSIISISIFYLIQSEENTKIQSVFESNARNRLAALKTDIVRHQEMVNSIAGLFSSSENVTRKEFHAFVKNALSRYPYIQGLSWNPLIKKSEKKRFIDKAHESGIGDFKITELNSDGQKIKAPVRGEYVAVYYIEPYLRNKEAMGFNIASNPARLKALKQARDTGLAVITERIILVQEKKGNFGYLLMKAIYQKGTVNDTVAKRRKHFAGLAVGVFRFGDWIPLSMRDIKPLGIDVLITDESAPAVKQFLHFHSSRTREEEYHPTQDEFNMAEKSLHWRTTVDILGRQWSFLFAPSPAFLNAHKSWLALASLATGLIFTILLSVYLHSKARHTRKLAKTNDELRAALNEIKTLRGIIPICSYCHSIRDDKGSWALIDAYLSEHSDAQFSHGVCPNCLEKALTDADIDKK